MPRFDDGTEATTDFRDVGRNRHPRKAMQLCAQVRRAIELTLLGDCDDEVLQDLMVETVEPAPDESRLRVLVSAHGAAAEIDPAEVHARLVAAHPLIHREVLRAITRKKAPELAYELDRSSSD